VRWRAALIPPPILHPVVPADGQPASYSAESDSVDVHPVSSIPGVYMANSLNTTTGVVVTLITYNKGATWCDSGWLAAWQRALTLGPARWPVHAPEGKNDCRSNSCFLHITMEHGELAGIPAPVSSPTANGIILAHGRIGSARPAPDTLTSRRSPLLHRACLTETAWSMPAIELTHTFRATAARRGRTFLHWMRKTFSTTSLFWTTALCWSCGHCTHAP